ncbi:hypothetical protein IFM89_011308 [Coptis chinensis]|uniref:Uncharacterized protein n=1 Tax=Coptis chinensis TaxID=261450 RepID=A0A835HUD9_9MAGN|nr:hypothetical protein IFM89_011308 [Coptis chinensis]
MRGTHPRTLLFYGSMVDLGVLASMASCMSTVSNIIYLDSPAGVGLSYSENQDDLASAFNNCVACADATGTGRSTVLGPRTELDSARKNSA